MSMTEVIKSIEHDALQQAAMQNNQMSLVEFAEEISPFPLSEYQKELLRKYEECEKDGKELFIGGGFRSNKAFILKLVAEWKQQNKLIEHRCSKCNRLLGKFNGQAEIKCPKCGEINRIGVK